MGHGYEGRSLGGVLRFRHTLMVAVCITLLSILLVVSIAAALWEYQRIEPYRSALLSSAIGMAITDTKRFVLVNRAFCRITGYSEEELQNRDWMSITHPEDRQVNVTLGNRMLAGELPAFLIEKRYITKRGSTVWVRNSI